MRVVAMAVIRVSMTAAARVATMMAMATVMATVTRVVASAVIRVSMTAAAGVATMICPHDVDVQVTNSLL
jgi:hypothetical protein